MASVNSAGEVTALTKGNAVITAEVNGESVTCTVTVRDESDAPDDGSTTTKPDDGSTTTKPDNSNKPSTGTTKVDVSSVYDTYIDPVDGAFDISMRLKEPASQFTVEGTTMTATWSGGNSSIATVTSDGTIKPIGRGTTTLTIKIGSTEISCTVRVTS